MLVLDSWLDTNMLNEGNRLEEISVTGFKVPSTGMVVQTGSA
jgi:hypothetical protein